jgi:hypothetical protein
MRWTLSDKGRPITSERRRSVLNLETGAEGFASVGWRKGPGGRFPFLFGAVTRPHRDSNGDENGDATTLDGDPEFV